MVGWVVVGWWGGGCSFVMVPEASMMRLVTSSGTTSSRPSHPHGDARFVATLWTIALAYALLLVGLLTASAWRLEVSSLSEIFASPALRHSMLLSLVSCTLSALLSIIVAVPAGYVLSRFDFRGKTLLEAIFDIPIALPPLVVGLMLLIAFQTPIGQLIERGVAALNLPGIRGVTYEVPAVVLAQFTVAAAFAIRAMRVAFAELSPRTERVALTLGCNRRQAFFRVALPEARFGVVGAFTLAWARSLGEFGPLLVFAGTTRMKTEVLSSSVYLELNVGNLQGALAVSLLMVTLAAGALVVARLVGADWGRR